MSRPLRGRLLKNPSFTVYRMPGFIRQIREAIHDAKVERARSRIRERIYEAVGTTPVVIYDAFPSENGFPIDNLDEIPVEGRLLIEDDIWDTPSKEAESPTWLQLAVICDQMIRASGDFQHVFLEGIEKLGETPDGRIRICFDLGS